MAQFAAADDVRRSIIKLRIDALERRFTAADEAYRLSQIRLTAASLEPLLARLVEMINAARKIV